MDLYQEVTNRIMEQLENGLIPWQKPWISARNAISHATGKPYSLLNQKSDAARQTRRICHLQSVSAGRRQV